LFEVAAMFPALIVAITFAFSSAMVPAVQFRVQGWPAAFPLLPVIEKMMPRCWCL
jgi:hypothetical protein